MIVRYCLLIFCVARTKVEEARVNSGHINVFFTISGPLKMLFSEIWFFYEKALFMTDFQSTYEILLFDKVLPSWNFRPYNSSPLNIFLNSLHDLLHSFGKQYFLHFCKHFSCLVLQEIFSETVQLSKIKSWDSLVFV